MRRLILEHDHLDAPVSMLESRALAVLASGKGFRLYKKSDAKDAIRNKSNPDRAEASGRDNEGKDSRTKGTAAQ